MLPLAYLSKFNKNMTIQTIHMNCWLNFSGVTLPFRMCIFALSTIKVCEKTFVNLGGVVGTPPMDQNFPISSSFFRKSWQNGL